MELAEKLQLQGGVHPLESVFAQWVLMLRREMHGCRVLEAGAYQRVQ